jgi:hypothetical protein
MSRRGLFFALLIGLCSSSLAQDVVSASPGVLQYFEGAVELNDRPIQHKAGVFPSLKDGSILKTGKGRAELILTPGVFLRMDEETSVRMLANSLTDTRLEVVNGAVLLDSLNSPPADVVTLQYKSSQIHFPQPGIFRIDCNLDELQTYSGRAEVRRGSASATPVDSQHLYYFALEFTTTKFGNGDQDEFYDWAHNRSDTIVEQNERASAEQEESQDPDPGAGGGLFGAVPSFALPPSMTPASGYGSFFNSYQYGNVVSPSSALNPCFFPAVTAVVFYPPWSRPTAVKRPPGIGPGPHPRPILNRWPTSTVAGSAGYMGSSGYRSPDLPVPAYQKPGIHVPAVNAPRLTPPPAAAHVAAPPVIRAVGHR